MTDSRPGLLFIVNSLGVGGAERQVVTLLNHLDTSRFRLHLVWLKPGEALLPHLRTERLDAFECAPASRRLDRAVLARLRSLVLRYRIDLIVSTNTYSTLYAALARSLRKERPRLLAVFHTTLLHRMKQRLAMQLYRHVFARCDRLLYVCETQREYWRERGLTARSDGVVHNGIDTAHFDPELAARERQVMRGELGFGAEDYVIGLCARLRPEKAPGDLLHAVARLRERGVRAHALLIGDGPLRTDVEALAASLGIAPHVRITGYQSDVRPFIAACDVMALVSHAIETFSLAALEAMACGKPLVMSDIGGAREQVVHGVHGFLFEPGDLNALTGHLAALTERERRETMGNAATERVRQCFTLERMVSAFEAQVAEMLGDAAAPAMPHAAATVSGEVSRRPGC